MKFWRKPLDADSFHPPHGVVHIINERCKGCRFCVEFCPKSVLEESEIFNSKGYHPPEVEYPENCVGCRLCELICPEFAIYVTIEEGPSEKPKSQAQANDEKGSSGDKVANGTDHGQEQEQEVKA